MEKINTGGSASSMRSKEEIQFELAGYLENLEYFLAEDYPPKSAVKSLNEKIKVLKWVLGAEYFDSEKEENGYMEEV